jgi:HEAT repeat protein
VRLAILRALREIAFQRYPGFREALRAIGEAADDDFETDELVRLRATEALWEAGKKDLLDPVPLLDRQLSDRSARLRLAAVKMLRKHGLPPAADVLGRAAQNKALSETVRLEAIEALGALAMSEGGVVGRQIAEANIATKKLLGIPPILSPASVDRRHERQIRLLAAVVQDPDNSLALVLRAVKSIGQVKDKSAIPVLQQIVLTHPHNGIRKKAAGVLSHVMARQYE